MTTKEITDELETIKEDVEFFQDHHDNCEPIENESFEATIKSIKSLIKKLKRNDLRR